LEEFEIPIEKIGGTEATSIYMTAHFPSLVQERQSKKWNG